MSKRVPVAEIRLRPEILARGRDDVLELEIGRFIVDHTLAGDMIRVVRDDLETLLQAWREVEG